MCIFLKYSQSITLLVHYGMKLISLHIFKPVVFIIVAFVAIVLEIELRLLRTPGGYSTTELQSQDPLFIFK